VNPTYGSPLGPASRVLVDKLVQRFPAWAGLARAHVPEARLDLVVASPAHEKTHRMGVRERNGGAYEVYYEHADPFGRAVADFLFTPDEPHRDAAETVDFVTGIVGEQILVVAEAPWYFGLSHGRFIARDAFFARGDRARFTVFSWAGTFDQRRT
jgi:hypothetical protein